MGYLPEREVCHMRRHIDFDKIGITDDVMFCTVLAILRIAENFYRESSVSRLRKLSSWEPR